MGISQIGRTHYRGHRLTTPQPLTTVMLNAMAARIDEYGVDREDRLAPFIREVGIESFEESIPQLLELLSHLELNSDDLRELVKYTRRTDLEETQTVREQHVVSKVILRHFCEPRPPQKGGLLLYFDLIRGKRAKTPVGPDGVAKVFDFVAKDSERAEAIWRTVEDQLQPALLALDTLNILHKPKHDTAITAIKDAIALHFARSYATWNIIHEGAKQPVALISAAMRNTPASDTTRRWATFVEMQQDGTYWRHRVVEVFLLVKPIARTRRLSILVAPPGKQFLIGDTPAVACNLVTGQVGQGVGFNEPAVLVAMPLRPDRLAILGPTDGWGQCTAADVDRFNTYQVQQAKEYVYHHPDTDFDTFIRSVSRPQQPAPRRA